MIATIACKAAVKSGDILDNNEMTNLIKDLLLIPNYQTCPHGRPTITIMPEKELEKRFKRT